MKSICIPCFLTSAERKTAGPLSGCFFNVGYMLSTTRLSPSAAGLTAFVETNCFLFSPRAFYQPGSAQKGNTLRLFIRAAA